MPHRCAVDALVIHRMMSNGTVGTPLLCKVVTIHGYLATALALAAPREFMMVSSKVAPSASTASMLHFFKRENFNCEADFSVFKTACT